MEVILPPRPPRQQICARPNCTHMLPSSDSIGTASATTTITETDSDSYQRSMNVLLLEV